MDVHVSPCMFGVDKKNGGYQGEWKRMVAVQEEKNVSELVHAEWVGRKERAAMWRGTSS